MEIERENKTWEMRILRQDGGGFDKFNQIYEQNRLAARIYSQTHAYVCHEIVEFIKGNVHIFIDQKISFGVSTTLKRYIHKRALSKVYLNTSNGKILIRNRIGNKMDANYHPVMPMTIGNTKIKNRIKEIFPWTQFVFEAQFPLSFTAIQNRELYTLADLCKYYYNIPNKQVALFVYAQREKYDVSMIFSKKNANVLKNIDNLNQEHLFNNKNFVIFKDAVLMANRLLRTINCAWSVKRMQQEHDMLSYEQSEITADFDNAPLQIHDQFKPIIPLIEELGGKVLKDTKELHLEGVRMHHCVAGYALHVNRGQCIIVHYNQITLQIGKDSNNTFKLLQQKKRFNEEPEEKEYSSIINILANVNNLQLQPL